MIYWSGRSGENAAGKSGEAKALGLDCCSSKVSTMRVFSAVNSNRAPLFSSAFMVFVSAAVFDKKIR